MKCLGFDRMGRFAWGETAGAGRIYETVQSLRDMSELVFFWPLALWVQLCHQTPTPVALGLRCLTSGW